VIELQILHRFCDNRADFLSYRVYFDSILPNIERELKLIYEIIGDYYEKYTDRMGISKEELFAYYKYKYPISKNDVMIKELIFDLFTVQLQDILMQDLLQQLKERYFATKIVNKLLPVVEGTRYGVFPTLKAEIDQFTSTQNTIDTDMIKPCTLSVEDLVNTTIVRDGLFWHIDDLSTTLGAIPIKSLGAVFGYVNASKTSFCVAASYNFARQLMDTQGVVVYAGNEEPAERIQLRFTQTATEMSSEEIKNNIEGVKTILAASPMKNILIYDSIVHIDQVEYLLEKHTPRILVVDQGTKVAINSKEKDVVKIQHLYNQYRTFANKYNTSIIVVSQGDATTANKKWLNLIGIGFLSDDPAKKHIRYINIPKNKGLMGKCISNFNEENCVWHGI